MEEKLEQVVEETAQQETPTREELKIDDTVEKIKVKKKPSMKKFSNDTNGVTKIDLSKSSKTEEVDVQESSGTSEKVVEEKQDEENKEEEKQEVVLEEITDEEEFEV